MPGSAEQGKAEIKEWVNGRSDIKTIIDVGCGSGTYRNLIGKGNYIWQGIEIFAPYIQRFNLLDLYDEIHIGDIYDFASNVIEGGLPEGDLIILGDVLEHLEKEKALFVLNAVLDKYPHVVLSIPVDGRPSMIHYGNEHEAHLSIWTYEELVKVASWDKSFSSKGLGIFIK